MKVAELFHSIQGEGALIGVPSVFIRTSGCNLRCGWCDTPYTSWEPEGDETPLKTILDYVRAHSTGHTVITGGEPMLAPDIVPLTEGLRDLDQHITIETAGTIFAPVACDLMSISPKLANSTPWDRDPKWAQRHEDLRIQPDVLKRLTDSYTCQLKFVVASADDLAEIQSLATALKVPRANVILMPEGVDVGTLRERATWLSELATQHGYRFTPRLHIELYGNRRGV